MTITSSRDAHGATGRRLGALLGAMFLFNVAGYAAIGAALQVLLPSQVEAADPVGKLSAFGLVTGVSAIASVCVPPIVGALSDRTRGRWGRRSPWILGGGLATLAALVLLGWMSTVAGLLIGWFLVQGTVNVGLNILIAVVADQVPERRRGLASTVGGLGVPVGSLAGTAAGAAFIDSALLAYTLLGVVFVAASALLALLSREHVTVAVAPGRVPLRAQLTSALDSLRARDYAWAFGSRAVMFLGYFAVSSFGLYILSDYIELPAGLAPQDALTLQTTVQTLCLVVGTIIAGPLADRLNRHKLFVLISSLMVTVSVALPVLAPVWPVQLATAVIGGLGFGAYLSVDQALVTLVLPAAEDSGRDLGVFHIALNAPQVVAPFGGSLVVAHLGGYPALFVTGGVLALVGALMILRVRGVR
ncbi:MULTISPECIES: MFS transporter [Nonomuraea]|jgi:MFS family permease|uniref:MFS transporter n=1 Tax=Nonomuraea salmonea TaxID=46181 RepID=A0ABV5NWG5_9ACTN